MNKNVFVSGIKYLDPHVGAAAVYCSDGRFVLQTEDFLYEWVGVMDCDRVVVPGGAGGLAVSEEVMEELRFLIDAHELKRVILIAHEDCGFYKAKLGLFGVEAQEPKQIDDIVEVARVLREMYEGILVEAYMAKVEGKKIEFAEIEV